MNNDNKGLAGSTGGQEKDYKRFAELVAEGKPLKQALMAAGYSENTASQGMHTVMKSQPLQEALLSIGVDYAKIGAKIDPTLATNAIKGRLFTNMVRGVGDGNEAAKMLGSMKDIGAFRDEANNNIIVIQSPVPAGQPELEGNEPTTLLGE